MIEIGPRQTVDRAKHPTLGEGRAIYNHGPAWFWSDDGEPVAMRSIDMGGGRAGPPRYDWLRGVTATGERIELETTDRASGDRHYRRWHPAHGPGWLVAIGGASWRKGGPTERWEGDNGTVIPMRVAVMKVGKPGDWTSGGSQRKGTPAEHENWFTYELDTGEVFVFRRATLEDVPVAEDKSRPIPATKPTRSTYDPRPASAHVAAPPSPAAPGSRWPDPSAPRSAIDAFVRERRA
jgi:hypothetical protein